MKIKTYRHFMITVRLISKTLIYDALVSAALAQVHYSSYTKIILLCPVAVLSYGSIANVRHMCSLHCYMLYNYHENKFPLETSEFVSL
jgi:hypothetical protein